MKDKISPEAQKIAEQILETELSDLTKIPVGRSSTFEVLLNSTMKSYESAPQSKIMADFGDAGHVKQSQDLLSALRKIRDGEKPGKVETQALEDSLLILEREINLRQDICEAMHKAKEMITDSERKIEIPTHAQFIMRDAYSGVSAIVENMHIKISPLLESLAKEMGVTISVPLQGIDPF